jgi:hypothetical protein
LQRLNKCRYHAINFGIIWKLDFVSPAAGRI